MFVCFVNQAFLQSNYFQVLCDFLIVLHPFVWKILPLIIIVFRSTSEEWNSEGRSCTKMVRWYTLLFIDKMPLFIGVTSCLWGLLLLLIRMYFWNHLATVSGKVECVAPTRPTRLLTRFLTLALNINHCRFVFCCCETV